MIASDLWRMKVKIVLQLIFESYLLFFETDVLLLLKSSNPWMRLLKLIAIEVVALHM